MAKQRDLRKSDSEISKQIRKLPYRHIDATLKDLLEIMKNEFARDPDSEILERLAYQYEALNAEKERRDDEQE